MLRRMGRHRQLFYEGTFSVILQTGAFFQLGSGFTLDGQLIPVDLLVPTRLGEWRYVAKPLTVSRGSASVEWEEPRSLSSPPQATSVTVLPPEWPDPATQGVMLAKCSL